MAQQQWQQLEEQQQQLHAFPGSSCTAERRRVFFAPTPPPPPPPPCQRPGYLLISCSIDNDGETANIMWWGPWGPVMPYSKMKDVPRL
ncbi:hypothetical protein O9K51_08073 [Purpureocillium lavendulum]|uniref:Uncharacterized protein n=1 Tax=Purpureocillium lavendulum TaxID=1247861 RepID=A0AB34FM24_9HYPO|nr:hypothetical protein O9K51_08073 [Purpureocillium lavendulum]